MSRALHITTEVSGFIPPSQQMKLGAFCVVKEVISWSDAGGGMLEIDQWQICGSGSQQLGMMKLYLGARPHLHALKPARTPGRAPAASVFPSTGSRGRDESYVPVCVLSSSFILGVLKKPGVRVEFFHSYYAEVNGWNIWVRSEHLGSAGDTEIQTLTTFSAAPLEFLWSM